MSTDDSSSIDADLALRHVTHRFPDALARALLPDPPLLLCDEPLSALDPITRTALQRELGELFARLRKTVLWVTHDLNEAAALAHSIVLMRAGRVVQQGTLAALIEAPADAFVTEFVNAQRGWLPAAPAQ
jgi:osmoprotectant transport system ATP-binding protein